MAHIIYLQNAFYGFPFDMNVVGSYRCVSRIHETLFFSCYLRVPPQVCRKGDIRKLGKFTYLVHGTKGSDSILNYKSVSSAF
jgi:hypothetical protein